MKKLSQKMMDWIHKRHMAIMSVILAVLLLSIITIIALHLIGYRFVIYEDVRPDWEASGTIFSFIASVGAISAAIIIPMRIAQKQNSIALFKEKYEVYKKCAIFLSRWHYSCTSILSAVNANEKHISCIVAVMLKLKKGDSAEEIIHSLVSDSSLKSGLELEMFDFYIEDLFLFPKASCLFQCVDESQITQITDAYNDFVDKLRIATVFGEFNDKFDETAKRFLDEIELVKKGELISRMADEIRELKS